ncbi:hypothetical protein KSP39_PZI022328 [Platanthera zijinensis]|uniref:Uncharacterized protein n=1 Tax=Platanthera zijinensis TaxID=2320716 RepID=A0AAP0AW62_9ASPA
MAICAAIPPTSVYGREQFDINLLAWKVRISYLVCTHTQVKGMGLCPYDNRDRTLIAIVPLMPSATVLRLQHCSLVSCGHY